MDWFFALLRVLHIGAGVFWVGGAFTYFLFVVPSTEVLPPPNRQAFLDEVAWRRRFARAIYSAATLTILAGAALYWLDSGGLKAAWLTSPSGLGFTLGGLAGFAAWLIAFAVILPTFTTLSRLGGELVAAGRAPTAEEAARLGSLASRLQIAGRALLTLLAIAVLFMAISRNLG
jgi:uncharacterized membrane protein